MSKRIKWRNNAIVFMGKHRLPFEAIAVFCYVTFVGSAVLSFVGAIMGISWMMIPMNVITFLVLGSMYLYVVLKMFPGLRKMFQKRSRIIR